MFYFITEMTNERSTEIVTTYYLVPTKNFFRLNSSIIETVDVSISQGEYNTL